MTTARVAQVIVAKSGDVTSIFTLGGTALAELSRKNSAPSGEPTHNRIHVERLEQFACGEFEEEGVF